MENKEEKNSFQFRLNANVSRTIQDQNYGGNEYESFKPGVSISMGVDDVHSPRELAEQMESLASVARYTLEQAIKKRKKELSGDRKQEDFLEDAYKAFAKLKGEAEMEGEEFPKEFSSDNIAPPISEREDENGSE